MVRLYLKEFDKIALEKFPHDVENLCKDGATREYKVFRMGFIGTPLFPKW